eukprot:TRINITY_DN52720_c0_g1_i1.p1 TRINITY_DN52720_c0_g1~~TRINITY_DN52720_c0_g1_i1.p1  ORF type:complete len:852 (-),score=207.11 TRINITY_DN52720_c0_g1_i1:107-2662(-)
MMWRRPLKNRRRWLLSAVLASVCGVILFGRHSSREDVDDADDLAEVVSSPSTLAWLWSSDSEGAGRRSGKPWRWRSRSAGNGNPLWKQVLMYGGAGLLVLLVPCLLCWWFWRRVQRGRALNRPYKLRQVSGVERAEDIRAEMEAVITWLQDTLIVPIDRRLPGRPFEFDLHAFPFTPLVLVIGNHSSGKSTFINELLGQRVQETGVAPTDDCFTVIERRTKGQGEDFEDGPTLLGCSENRPYRDLQRFGGGFVGKVKRKRLVLPEDSRMPYGLQIVDTPGMINMPTNMSAARERGYNFVEAVRWWAKRADLVLLLFDPLKPGTTGETLEVLTKSLTGLDHKYLVLLNKIDQLDNVLDFGRAYGTLGWALSKVLPHKDMPPIFTTFNDAAVRSTKGDGYQQLTELPLEAFQRKVQAVVTECLRAKVRHYDNVITALAETLRQVEMMGAVCEALRVAARRQLLRVTLCGLLIALVPLAVAWWSLPQMLPSVPKADDILPPVVNGPAAGSSSSSSSSGKQGQGWFQRQEMPVQTGPSDWLLVLGWLIYGGYVASTWSVLRLYRWQCEQEQVMEIDKYFQSVHAARFVHNDGEDFRIRWRDVRPKVLNICRAVSTLAVLPRVAAWETARIREVLEKDLWYLRELAKLVRGPDPAAPMFTDPHRILPTASSAASVGEQRGGAPTGSAEAVTPRLSPRVDAPRAETTRAEATRAEARRSKASFDPPATAESILAEVSRAEAARAEVSRAEALRAEARRSKGSFDALSNGDETRSESSRSEARTEALRADARRSKASSETLSVAQARRAEEARAEALRAEARRSKAAISMQPAAAGQASTGELPWNDASDKRSSRFRD